MIRVKSGAFIFELFRFWLTLHSNAINERVVETHGDKYPAFVAIAAFLWHPDSIAHPWLSAGPGDIPMPALFPE